jgi:hypothetical protein
VCLRVSIIVRAGYVDKHFTDFHEGGMEDFCKSADFGDVEFAFIFEIQREFE